MWRWVVRLLVVLLLLQSGACAVLWIRSYFAYDSYDWMFEENSPRGFTVRHLRLTLSYGGLAVDTDQRGFNYPFGGSKRVYYHHGTSGSLRYPRLYLNATSDAKEPWQALGFGLRPANGWGIGVVLPFWFLLLVTLLFPAAVADRRLRRRRMRGFPVQFRQKSERDIADVGKSCLEECVHKTSELAVAQREQEKCALKRRHRWAALTIMLCAAIGIAVGMLWPIESPSSLPEASYPTSLPSSSANGRLPDGLPASLRPRIPGGTVTVVVKFAEADPPVWESLSQHIRRYYDQIPGGFEQAVRSAQEAAAVNNTEPMLPLRYDMLHKKWPVVFTADPKDSDPYQMRFSTEERDGLEVTEVAIAIRVSKDEARRQSMLEHGLTEAWFHAEYAIGGMQRDWQWQEMLRRLSAYSDPVRLDMIDLYLAAFKRAWAHRRGELLDTVEKARRAVEQGLPEVWDAYLLKLLWDDHKDPRIRKLMLERMLELV